MMISERHDKILALLNKRGRISIQELQQLMLVSVSTLRRDLDQLAESGEVQRIHGGVELTKQQQTLQHEALLSQKNEMNLSAKQVIALSLIHISEPTRRTPISYAVFCLKKKKQMYTT